MPDPQAHPPRADPAPARGGDTAPVPAGPAPRDGPPPPLYWSLGATLTRADIPGLCERLAGELRATGATVLRCDVGAIGDPDVATVEAVARLALVARRARCRLVLERAGERLRELVTLTGLSGVLGLPGVPGTARCSPHRGREAEQREQPFGVEEAVQAGDPPG